MKDLVQIVRDRLGFKDEVVSAEQIKMLRDFIKEVQGKKVVKLESWGFGTVLHTDLIPDGIVVEDAGDGFDIMVKAWPGLRFKSSVYETEGPLKGWLYMRPEVFEAYNGYTLRCLEFLTYPVVKEARFGEAMAHFKEAARLLAVGMGKLELSGLPDSVTEAFVVHAFDESMTLCALQNVANWPINKE